MAFVILKRMCPLIQPVMKQSPLHSFASLLKTHRIIAMMIILLICIIIIFLVLQYLENSIFTALFNSDNSPLHWDNNDNHFYVIDTDVRDF